jgi:hypothetical protein
VIPYRAGSKISSVAVVDRRAGLKSDGYALLYEIDDEALSGGAIRGKRLVRKIKRKSRMDRGIVRGW